MVTNDIYTTEDADFLRRNAVLPDDRIEAVQTGCCPHTAIRDDITANLDATAELIERHPDLDLILVESRRRQPHRDLLATGWSTRRSSSSTWPAGTRCRARAGPA